MLVIHLFMYSLTEFYSPYTAGISIWNTYPDGSIVGYHDGYFDSCGSMDNYIGVFFIYNDCMVSPGNGNGCTLSYG